MKHKIIFGFMIGSGLLFLAIQTFQNHLHSSAGVAFAQVENKPKDGKLFWPTEPVLQTPKKPVRLPERKPTISAETFQMLETIEKKNRELNRREEKFRVREQHLKALEAKIKGDLKKIDDALVRSQEQIGIQQETIKNNIQALTKAYSSMKPAEAARLLEALDENLALQIISSMKSKVAGKVLSRLKIRVAKNISEKLAGKRKDSPPKKRRK